MAVVWTVRAAWERGGSTSTGNSRKVLLHPGSASGTPGGNRETTNDLSAPSQPRRGQVPLLCAPTDSAHAPWEYSSPVLHFSVDASVFLRTGTVFICLSASQHLVACLRGSGLSERTTAMTRV